MFTLSAGDKLFLSKASINTTATLQRRSSDGSQDWVDLPIIQSLSTSTISSISADLNSWLSSGFTYRFRFAVPCSVWVGVDPAISTGSAAIPNIDAPVAIYNYITPAYPTGQALLSSLPTGSKVLLFKAGQSNWQGGGPDGYIGTPPQKTKYWNGSAFILIKDGGYRGAANPSYYFANEFERLYPNLELLLVEGGEGGSGFYGNKWEVGGALRTTVINTFSAATVVAKAITTGPVYVWGMTWNQGEADADTLAHATEYANALPLFVTAVRAVTDATLKFVPTRLNDSLVGYNQLNAIRSVHQSFSPFVDIDSVPMHTDNIHYTRTGYQQIGERQYAVMAAQSLKQINTVSAPEPPPALPDFNFINISSIPSGFTLAGTATLTYNSAYTEVNRGASNNWSTSYLQGTPLNWTTSDIAITYIQRGLSGVGVSDDYSTGLFSSSENLVVVQSGAVFYKGNQVATFAAAQTTDQTYTLVFSKTGTSTATISLFTGSSTTPTEVLNLTGITPTFNTPRPVIDSSYTNLRVTRIRNKAR